MGAHDSVRGGASAMSTADAMDAMHEKGMKAFPAPTEGRGNQLLAARVEHGVKVYDRTVKVVQWEVEPGRRVEAWTYNGVVPAPQIRVREGDRVRVHLENELPQSTVIHFHGLEVPNDQDGVPFLTQPPVKPGAAYTYEFTVPNSGSHMYHSHHDSTKQVGLGLLGAFIVEPKDRTAEPGPTSTTSSSSTTGCRLHPERQALSRHRALVARLGQRVRIRYMNEV